MTISGKKRKRNNNNNNQEDENPKKKRNIEYSVGRRSLSRNSKNNTQDYTFTNLLKSKEKAIGKTKKQRKRKSRPHKHFPLQNKLISINNQKNIEIQKEKTTNKREEKKDAKEPKQKKVEKMKTHSTPNNSKKPAYKKKSQIMGIVPIERIKAFPHFPASPRVNKNRKENLGLQGYVGSPQMKKNKPLKPRKNIFSNNPQRRPHILPLFSKRNDRDLQKTKKILKNERMKNRQLTAITKFFSPNRIIEKLIKEKEKERKIQNVVLNTDKDLKVTLEGKNGENYEELILQNEETLKRNPKEVTFKVKDVVETKKGDLFVVYKLLKENEKNICYAYQFENVKEQNKATKKKDNLKMKSNEYILIQKEKILPFEDIVGKETIHPFKCQKSLGNYCIKKVSNDETLNINYLKTIREKREKFLDWNYDFNFNSKDEQEDCFIIDEPSSMEIKEDKQFFQRYMHFGQQFFLDQCVGMKAIVKKKNYSELIPLHVKIIDLFKQVETRMAINILKKRILKEKTYNYVSLESTEDDYCIFTDDIYEIYPLRFSKKKEHCIKQTKRELQVYFPKPNVFKENVVED